MKSEFLNIAVIGGGYWGKNLIRNFANAERCNLKYVCDLDENVLDKHKRDFPYIQASSNIDEVLSDSTVDAVAIATGSPTHFELAKKVIEAGKHVYVEKPLALRSAEARLLVSTAERNRLKLMVGHLLEYHPAVTYMKKLIDSPRTMEGTSVKSVSSRSPAMMTSASVRPMPAPSA